jgi:DNA-binding transcriptional LysR family regulator
MNLLHLKYAVEVDKTRSINKAAENLYMGQPNLSRAIKELEESLGITIFKRTSKGITPTPKGEEFLEYAKNILAQVDEMEALYNKKKKGKQEFNISVPRASYISLAFCAFVNTLDQARKSRLITRKQMRSKRLTTFCRRTITWESSVINLYSNPISPTL